MKDDLNDRQELFCLEYLIDLNATKAATRAGYSEKTAGAEGSRLLKNVKIRARVREMMQARSEQTLVDACFVIENLVEVVQRSLQAKEVEKWNHEKGCYTGTGEYEFNAHGANKALELLGKHLGIFEKDNTQKKDTSVLSSESLADMINKINASSTR